MDFAMFEKFANNSGSEEGVAARFYDRAVKTGEVGENGLPKFKLVCFCEIRIKDNTSEIYDQARRKSAVFRPNMPVISWGKSRWWTERRWNSLPF